MAEIALALVLLVGAGLMVKSFLRLQQTELGFRPDNLLTMRIALPWRKYNDAQGPERQKQFLQQLLDRLSALPGVESAAMTGNLPLSSERQEGNSLSPSKASRRKNSSATHTSTTCASARTTFRRLAFD